VDFDLPESAIAVRDGVAAVAARYDHAYWSRCEEQHEFPTEAWRDLADGGWIGLCVPEEYGGGGAGMLELAIACETLAASGGTAGIFLYILTPGFGAMTLARHGTAEQKQAILPGVATGDVQFCLALTEPDAGSNALAITTSARRDGDDFVLQGQKTWISGVENADWMLVVTRTTALADARPRTAGFTLFLVDVTQALAEGTLTYHPIPKLGGNVVTSSQVFLDGVRVPVSNVVGTVDEGFGVLWDVLNPERILAAAGGVGGAEAALRLAADYARPAQGQDRARPTDDLQGGLALRPGTPVRQRDQRGQADRRPGGLGIGRPGVPDLRWDGLLQGAACRAAVPRQPDRQEHPGRRRAHPRPHRHPDAGAAPQLLNTVGPRPPGISDHTTKGDPSARRHR
jgi:alkylation response protein AidB-like acyl-CoA dehydrogenase